MRVTVDGQAVEVPAGLTIGALKIIAGISEGDSLVTLSKRGATFRDDAEFVTRRRYRKLVSSILGGL